MNTIAAAAASVCVLWKLTRADCCGIADTNVIIPARSRKLPVHSSSLICWYILALSFAQLVSLKQWSVWLRSWGEVVSDQRRRLLRRRQSLNRHLWLLLKDCFEIHNEAEHVAFHATKQSEKSLLIDEDGKTLFVKGDTGQIMRIAFSEFAIHCRADLLTFRIPIFAPISLIQSPIKSTNIAAIKASRNSDATCACISEYITTSLSWQCNNMPSLLDILVSSVCQQLKSYSILAATLWLFH